MQNLVSLGLMARYREIWQVFPIQAHAKLVTPEAGPNLNPRAIIWALLVDGIFGNPRPHGYVQGEFYSFLYIIPCKTCDPRGGVKFDPRAII